MSQELEDTLTTAYRRASEADAGRPAATTRKAILAEAAAVARRRAPTANASRYWPRMAAGIAVLGVAVMLWRQVDHRMPGDAPMVVQAPATAEVEGVVESTLEPALEPAPEAAPAPAKARRTESARADTPVAEPLPAMPIPTPPQPAPPDPFPNSPRVAATESAPPEPTAVVPQPAAPPVVSPAAPPLLAGNQRDEEQELAEVPVTGSRVLPPNRARGGVPGARAGGAPGAGAPGGGAAPRAGQGSRPNVDRVALLRQHFPEQYQSDAAHSLWLVQNAAGEVLLSGELASGQLLEDLKPQIARALGGREPGAWQTGIVRNARDQPITLSIARLSP